MESDIEKEGAKKLDSAGPELNPKNESKNSKTYGPDNPGKNPESVPTNYEYYYYITILRCLRAIVLLL